MISSSYFSKMGVINNSDLAFLKIQASKVLHQYPSLNVQMALFCSKEDEINYHDDIRFQIFFGVWIM